MCHIPVIIRLGLYVNPFVVEGVASRSLLVLGAHEVAIATLMVVGSSVQEKFYHGRVFVYYCYMEHAFTYAWEGDYLLVMTHTYL